MRIILISLLGALLFQLNAYSQNDAEAVKILDTFSAQALSAPSVFMRFNLITTDQTDDSKSSATGSIILSKDKYKLDLKDNIIWFNGSVSWSLLPVENEVTITKPDKNDNSFQSRPSTIFTMYRTGYKSRLIEEKTDSWIIDLYPEDIKSDHIRVRLIIGKAGLQLKSAEYRRKDGISMTIEIAEYNLKLKPEASAFVFSPEKHKGVEIIDMR